MKRRFTLFLALVVSLLTLQASAAMYIVGDGPFGGWNPAGGVTMTGKPDGTYTYTDHPITILHDLQIIKGSLQHCLAQEDTGAFVKVELIDSEITPEFAITELKAHFSNLVTVTSGIKDTWEADLNKPTAQFASFEEAVDSFCEQIDIPEFNDVQKTLIEEALHEVTNS